MIAANPHLMITILLPLPYRLDHFSLQVVPDCRVEIAESICLDKNSFPGRLRGPVLWPFVDRVRPFLGPGFKVSGISLLNLRPLLDQRDQVVAQLVPVLNPLCRPAKKFKDR